MIRKKKATASPRERNQEAVLSNFKFATEYNQASEAYKNNLISI